MKMHGVELHDDEEVITVVRQYRVAVVAPLAIAVFLILAPLFMLVILMGIRWHVGAVIFWLSISSGLIFGLRTWIRYRGTMLIFTNQRIVDIYRHGFFEKTVSEIPYTSLSDVSYRSKGLWETLVGAGTINFQMIGGKENVAFRNLGDPSAVQKMVSELRARAARGDEKVADPVEGMLKSMEQLSPTEQRALLVSMKRSVPPLTPSSRIPDDVFESLSRKNKQRRPSKKENPLE